MTSKLVYRSCGKKAVLLAMAAFSIFAWLLDFNSLVFVNSFCRWLTGGTNDFV